MLEHMWLRIPGRTPANWRELTSWPNLAAYKPLSSFQQRENMISNKTGRLKLWLWECLIFTGFVDHGAILLTARKIVLTYKRSTPISKEVARVFNRTHINSNWPIRMNVSREVQGILIYRTLSPLWHLNVWISKRRTRNTKLQDTFNTATGL